VIEGAGLVDIEFGPLVGLMLERVANGTHAVRDVRLPLPSSEADVNDL